MIYFDNAATSWPKPPQMIRAMQQFSQIVGANPGRAGHQMAIQSARIVYETRQRLADLFNVEDPLRICFTSNVTEALNLAILGLLKTGDHVITSGMEHNAVMRPLRYLQSRDVEITLIPCNSEGFLDPEDVKKNLQPNTRLVVLNHASNVTGTIMPISAVGKITKEYEVPLLVDAAQTAGVLPINIQSEYIDLLAFTGHKSLYGPMGTGGLVFGKDFNIDQISPLKYGGTGSNSEFEKQPDFPPDKFESGTLNVIGLAGLNASLGWIQNKSLKEIHQHEMRLVGLLLEGLKEIKGVKIFGPHTQDQRTSVISFTINQMDNAYIGQILDEKYGIQCRIGLHCAPSAAKTIGSFPQGTVRFSPGFFNKIEDIENAIEAVRNISRGRV